MGQRIIISESEKNNIRLLYEQSSNMLSFEKVVDVPDMTKDNLFNSLKGNRELFRNGSLQNEISGQQLKIEKEILLDKNMYKSLGFSPGLSWTCWYGPLKFDITIIVKDNKYKIICDNFIWTNQGSGCQQLMSLNPLTKDKPKGLTTAYAWDTVSKAATKYVDNFLNQIITTSNDDF